MSPSLIVAQGLQDQLCGGLMMNNVNHTKLVV
jgi:hypothetical protein